jgi:hypothetical protein
MDRWYCSYNTGSAAGFLVVYSSLVANLQTMAGFVIGYANVNPLMFRSFADKCVRSKGFCRWL